MRIGLGIGLINKSTTGGAIPPAISSVTISGTSVVGQVLTATASGVTGTPAPTLSYQWKRGATNIGTNSTTYTLVAADAGNTSNITCVVTATNAAGSANATSNQIAQILTVRTSAFLTASAISDATIRGGLNTFDIGLISNSLDTKMKALYPFVADGADNNARALQQRWNFMDARDLDAAFRLQFFGGGTHSANGYSGNGSNAYADTFLSTSNLTNNNHLSIYIRTNVNEGKVDIGAFGTSSGLDIESRNGNSFYGLNFITGVSPSISNTDSRGFYTNTRTTSTNHKIYKNGTLQLTNTALGTSGFTRNILIAARNETGTPLYFASKQYAFASIGDGLTDTDATNLYNLTQALQTTLGRSVGPQVVSDPDAQAFVTAADIQDQVQATAVNNLVIGMKAQGLWTKMNAIYPFVGGTADTHKYNLKNPLNTDAAFRLSFIGTVTHSSNGVQGNGTNGYADTFFIPNSNGLSVNNNHLSIYSRTAAAGGASNFFEMGSANALATTDLTGISTRRQGDLAVFDSGNFVNNRASYTETNGSGFFLGKVNSDLTSKFFRNGTQAATRTITTQAGLSSFKTFILAFNENNVASYFSAKQIAFVSMGTGLSDAEATDCYTLVQQFQTTLGRQV